MYNYLIHPIIGDKISLFSLDGKKLLKDYIRLVQSGGNTCDKKPNICSKCACECERMRDYGEPNSDVTRRAFYTCVNCAQSKLNLLKEQQNLKINKNTLEYAIRCGEEAKKRAKSGGINLQFKSNPRYTSRTSRTSRTNRTNRTSRTSHMNRTNNSANCEEVKNIIDNMLAGLNNNKTFEISLNQVYKLLFRRKELKENKLIVIDSDPAYKSTYKELKSTLNQYRRVVRSCIITQDIKSNLIKIFRFFIDNNDDGGSELPDLPSNLANLDDVLYDDQFPEVNLSTINPVSKPSKVAIRVDPY